MKQGSDESLVLAQIEAEDHVHEMLLLAARLRASEGGELDDTSIAAVSEATGYPQEYVRSILLHVPSVTKKKQSLWDKWKASYLSFDPDVRRYVVGGLLGLGGAFLLVLHQALRDGSGLLMMMVVLSFLAGLWNAGPATRSAKAAAITGGLQGTVFTLGAAFFAFIYQGIYQVIHYWQPNAGSPLHVEPMMLVVGLCLGVLSASAVHGIVAANRQKLGLSDPQQERHRLLQQLLEIRQKLESDSQTVTFLSVDIVGSTKMKAEFDPLDIEFTFNEYHQYVEQVIAKHQGRVHSTAGDGVTCVFQSASGGLAAAKALMAGLFEFNAFRNRLGSAIILRSGVHTGDVLAAGKDMTNVNFAHVIDVAAHMQKNAPPGGLMVSEETAKAANSDLSAIGQDFVEVQGFKGAVWKPATLSVPVFARTTN